MWFVHRRLLALIALGVGIGGCSELLGDFSVSQGLANGSSVLPVDDGSVADAIPGEAGGNVADAAQGHVASESGPNRNTDATVRDDATASADAGADRDAGIGGDAAGADVGASRDAGIGGDAAGADVGANGDAALDRDAAGCAPSTIACGGSCVLSTDIHNCSTCGHDCAQLANVSSTSVACTAGRCAYQCAPGYADCAGAGTGCATSLSTAAHCGDCGTTCAVGTPLCAATNGGGVYACTSGCPTTAPTPCAGSCVDEQTNAAACGGCGAGFVCAMGTTCQGGRCVGPSLSLLPLQYAFATTAVRATSAPQPFVLSNMGNGPSGSLTTGIGGANATDFVIASDTCNGKAVAASTSCTVSVEFAPKSRGAKSATFNINGGQPFATLTATGQDTVNLAITKSGTGGGTVSGDQIACGSTCTEPVTIGSTDPTITLTAIADASSVFSGWSGDCSGASATCTVTMSQARTVNAQFDTQTVLLTVTGRTFGPGSGTLTSTPAGINCAVPCTQSVSVPVGSSVTLRSSGGPLVWWGAGIGCAGPTCSLVMTAAVNLVVTFSGNNFIFPTSTTHDGNLGGLSGADALCKQTASAAGLPGSYVAWLATSTTNAASRLGAARGWVRPDGLPFADTVAALKAGQVFYPPVIDELGQPAANGVFTGANVDGSLVTGQGNFNCNDFTSNSAALTGSGGGSTGGSFTWTNGQGLFCSSLGQIYCFGTSLINPITFTPAVGRRAFVSTGTLTTSLGLGGADSLCRAEAAAANLPNSTKFLAMLPSTTASAVSRFNLSSTNWVRPDGVAITATPADVENGLIAAVTEHADGTYTNAFIPAAAGAPLTSDVGTAATTCGNWSNTSGTLDIAEPGYTGYGWFQFSMASCANPPNVFCFEN